MALPSVGPQTPEQVAFGDSCGLQPLLERDRRFSVDRLGCFVAGFRLAHAKQSMGVVEPFDIVDMRQGDFGPAPAATDPAKQPVRPGQDGETMIDRRHLQTPGPGLEPALHQHLVHRLRHGPVHGDGRAARALRNPPGLAEVIDDELLHPGRAHGQGQGGAEAQFSPGTEIPQGTLIGSHGRRRGSGAQDGIGGGLRPTLQIRWREGRRGRRQGRMGLPMNHFKGIRSPKRSPEQCAPGSPSRTSRGPRTNCSRKGERPTVDGVRTRLGIGSPGTVGEARRQVDVAIHERDQVRAALERAQDDHQQALSEGAALRGRCEALAEQLANAQAELKKPRKAQRQLAARA